MDELTPHQLLKIQRRATRRGFLVGALSGALGMALADAMIKLQKVKREGGV